jgi:DHA1 family tetracycline resistance protein-like MFS transporter
LEKRKLVTVFIIVFIDLLGFSLILPLLPYYAETFGASPTLVGLLVGSYAAAQLIGAPVLGRLSDRYGRRPILLLSILGTFLGFLLLGFARSLWMLFASRILDGLTGGNISVAQAYITDVTDEKNRAKGLGLIGAAFGLGFVIGPAVGGVLSTWGYAVPALAAAGLSGLNLITVFTWLPESLSEARRAEISQRPRSAFSLGALWHALNRPRVGPLLHVRLFFGLASATFQSIFALYAQYRLGLTAQSTGYLLAYVGVLVVLVQGVAIGRLTARFSESRLIFSAVVLMAASLLAWAFAPNLPVLLVVLAPLSLATGTLNTVINSALTKAVYPEEVGGTLGLSASLESLTRVIAPSAGGLLLEKLGAAAPGVAGALIMAWTVSYVWRRLIACPDPPLPAREFPGTGWKPLVKQPVAEDEPSSTSPRPKRPFRTW